MSVLMGGFAASQMLYVATRLKLADALARAPMSAEQLAEECGARPDPLRRVVRALAAFGVFEVLEDGRIANTPLSRCLRAGVPGSLREQALLYGEEHYHAMSELLHAVKHGGTAFEHAYRKPHFTYLTSNPEAATTYYDALSDATAQSAEAVAGVYRFARDSTVIDLAGGLGQLIRAVLHRNPSVKGVLVESSGLARRARARLRTEGLEGRCDVQVGDIFEAVPTGGDVYMLGNVLHALDDARALGVLRACRRAMGSKSRLLVVERVLPELIEDGLTAQHTFLADIVALAVSGGRERTVAEHSHLLAEAGLELAQLRATAAGDSIIEAT
jgi:SAM-dependent methyltransferase